MNQEIHPLIESVTEPLAGDPAQRIEAEALLGQHFNAAHPGVADTAARLAAAKRQTFPAMRGALLWCLAALCLAAAGYLYAPTLSSLSGIPMSENIFTIWKKTALPAGLTEEQRLLLGDPKLDAFEQKQRLHHHAPDNPAYFEEYALRHLSDRESLPPDFLKTAARIAPDNAYFLYIAASLKHEALITKKRSGAPSSPPRIVDGVRLGPLFNEEEYEIHDPVAFEEIIKLVGKATALSGIETYKKTMARARVNLLPDDTVAQLTRILFYAYNEQSGMIRLMNISKLFCARAEQLSKSGRKEDFLTLAAQRDAFIAQLGRNPDSNLINELIYAVIASSTATNFHFAAEHLGLTEMAEIYRKQRDAFQSESDQRRIRIDKERSPFDEGRASYLTQLSVALVGFQVATPPPLRDADLKPMRMAEREVLSGLGMLATAIIITFAVPLVLLFRFAAPPKLRLLAKRMIGVLGGVDWLWVVGLGVVVPIFFFLFVTRLTPLGGQEWGSRFFVFMFPGIQHVALLLTLLTAPALVVRWRLMKRLAPFGLGDRFTVPLATAVLTLVAVWALVALPIALRFENEMLNPVLFLAPPSLFLILLLAHAILSVCAKPAARLLQTATAMAVLPIYPIAIIILCALTPLYAISERRWLAKDTLLRIDPDAPDLGAYEFKIAALRRQEINKITGVR